MQGFLKQKGSAFATWLGAWCKQNVDFAFILAVFTETPRWTVTFMAIHEPLWIGIPLGVLLAFATSKVWRHYFVTRNRWSLAFNVASIVLAMLVITPVLYAMTETSPKEVDVTVVFADLSAINPARMIWAACLALLTFVPLVQLAAVHGAQPAKIEQALQPVVQSSSVQSAKSSTQEYKTNAQPKLAQVDPEDAHRARLLKNEGLNNTQIAQDLGVHRNTVTKLLKMTNGYKEATA